MISSALQFISERRKRFQRSDTAPLLPSGAAAVTNTDNSGKGSPSSLALGRKLKPGVVLGTLSADDGENTPPSIENQPISHPLAPSEQISMPLNPPQSSRHASPSSSAPIKVPSVRSSRQQSPVINAPTLVVSPPHPIDESPSTSESMNPLPNSSHINSSRGEPNRIPLLIPSQSQADQAIYSTSSSPGGFESSTFPSSCNTNPSSDLALSSSLEDMSSIGLAEASSTISSDLLSQQLSLGSIDEASISPVPSTGIVGTAFLMNNKITSTKTGPLSTPKTLSSKGSRRKILSRRRGSQSATLDTNFNLDSPTSGKTWQTSFTGKTSTRSMEDIIREEKLFWLAISQEDCETVKTILSQHDKGELVNRVNPFGLQPLDMVCVLGQEALLIVLLEFEAVNNSIFFGLKDGGGKERLAQHLNHCIQELGEQLLRYNEALTFSPQQEKIYEEMRNIEDQHCLLCSARYGLHALPLPPEPPSAEVEVVSADSLQVFVRAPPTEFMVTRYLISWSLVKGEEEESHEMNATSALVDSHGSPSVYKMENDANSTIVAAHYPQGLYTIHKLATNCTYSVRIQSWNLSGYSSEARQCKPNQVRLTTWFNQMEHVDRNISEHFISELNAMQNEIQQELCFWLTTDYNGRHGSSSSTQLTKPLHDNTVNEMTNPSQASSLLTRSPNFSGSAQRKRRLLQLFNIGLHSSSGNSGISNLPGGIPFVPFPFKYSRHVKRGLYIALIYSCVDKILLYDDALPLIKVDAEENVYTSAAAQSDVLWLMRLIASKFNLKMLAHNLMQQYPIVPTGLQQRVKLILAIYQIQSSLCPTSFGVGEILPNVIFRDNACILFLVHQMQHFKEITLTGNTATTLKWTSGSKLSRRIQQCCSGLEEHFTVTKNCSSTTAPPLPQLFGSNPTVPSAPLPTAEEELYSHLDEIIRKHPRKVADRLSPGLYLGYLRLRLFHDQLQILHSESHHNVPPTWLIREKNHVTLEEWAALKSISSKTSSRASSPSQTSSCEEFLRAIYLAWKRLSEALHLSSEDRERSRLYLGELFPLDNNVTLMIITAAVDEVCLNPTDFIPWQPSEFAFLHFAVFEHWLYYTYDNAFYSLCTTLKSILDLLVPLALKCQRQAFNDAEAIRQHKRRVDIFTKFQQRLEEIWTSKRWTKDIIVRSRNIKGDSQTTEISSSSSSPWLLYQIFSNYICPLPYGALPITESSEKSTSRKGSANTLSPPISTIIAPIIMNSSSNSDNNNFNTEKDQVKINVESVSTKSSENLHQKEIEPPTFQQTLLQMIEESIMKRLDKKTEINQTSEVKEAEHKSHSPTPSSTSTTPSLPSTPPPPSTSPPSYTPSPPETPYFPVAPSFELTPLCSPTPVPPPAPSTSPPSSTPSPPETPTFPVAPSFLLTPLHSPTPIPPPATLPNIQSQSSISEQKQIPKITVESSFTVLPHPDSGLITISSSSRVRHPSNPEKTTSSDNHLLPEVAGNGPARDNSHHLSPGNIAKSSSYNEISSPTTTTAAITCKLGSKFLRGTLLVYAGYQCGLVEGTSVRLQITSRTTTREIVNLVVRKLWNIRHTGTSQAMKNFKDEELQTYYLMVCLGSTERPLREEFHPLLLQEPWNKGKLIVRGRGVADVPDRRES